MRLSRLAISLTLFMCVGFYAHAQELWQGAQVGMSLEEVQSVHPNALTPNEPDTLHNGASENLRSKPFKTGEHTIVASFFFLDEKLSQVTLSVDMDGIENSEVKYIFDNLSDAITLKYGNPINIEETSIGYKSGWFLENGVNISLTAIDKILPLVNIVYQVRISEMSNKL